MTADRPSPQPLPCPFCGAEPKIFGDTTDANRAIVIVCHAERDDTSHARVQAIGYADAIAKWNSRVESRESHRVSPSPNPETRMFPIQDGPDIPWSVIAPFEKYAMRNHGGQSLERLAERGGLGVAEAIAVLRCEHFEYPTSPMPEQIKTLLALVATPSSSSPAPDDQTSGSEEDTRDAERLDWIEANGLPDQNVYDGHTLREAVDDAARSASPSPAPDSEGGFSPVQEFTSAEAWKSGAVPSPEGPTTDTTAKHLDTLGELLKDVEVSFVSPVTNEDREALSKQGIYATDKVIYAIRHQYARIMRQAVAAARSPSSSPVTDTGRAKAIGGSVEVPQQEPPMYDEIEHAAESISQLRDYVQFVIDLHRDGKRASVDDCNVAETSVTLLADLARRQKKQLAGSASPSPSAAPATYCAQCILNGAGRFKMRDDGCCPNYHCVLYEHGHAERPADLQEAI